MEQKSEGWPGEGGQKDWDFPTACGNAGGQGETRKLTPFPPSNTCAHSDPPLRLFIISSKKKKKINKINNTINKEETLINSLWLQEV